MAGSCLQLATPCHGCALGQVRAFCPFTETRGIREYHLTWRCYEKVNGFQEISSSPTFISSTKQLNAIFCAALNAFDLRGAKFLSSRYVNNIRQILGASPLTRDFHSKYTLLYCQQGREFLRARFLSLTSHSSRRRQDPLLLFGNSCDCRQNIICRFVNDVI